MTDELDHMHVVSLKWTVLRGDALYDSTDHCFCARIERSLPEGSYRVVVEPRENVIYQGDYRPEEEEYGEAIEARFVVRKSSGAALEEQPQGSAALSRPAASSAPPAVPVPTALTTPPPVPSPLVLQPRPASGDMGPSSGATWTRIETTSVVGLLGVVAAAGFWLRRRRS